MVLALLSAGVDSFLLERLPLSFYSRSTAVAGTYRTSCRVPHCQKTPFLSPSVAHPLNFCSRRKHAGSRNAAIGGDGVAEGGERKLMSASVFDEWVEEAWRDRDGYDRDKGQEETKFSTETEEEWIERARQDWLANKGALVYGEISVAGFRGVARKLRLSRQDCFFDLGSGVGKTVAQAWLENGVRSSAGVELAMERHQRGVLAMADILARYTAEFSFSSEKSQEKHTKTAAASTCSGSEEKREKKDTLLIDYSYFTRTYSFCNGSLALAQGDILDMDLSETTVVWCANVCFSPDFDRQIANMLAECPKLRAIAVIKNFPEGVAGFQYEGSHEFQMSWSKECQEQGLGSGGLVHFYFRHLPAY